MSGILGFALKDCPEINVAIRSDCVIPAAVKLAGRYAYDLSVGSRRIACGMRKVRTAGARPFHITSELMALIGDTYYIDVDRIEIAHALEMLMEPNPTLTTGG